MRKRLPSVVFVMAYTVILSVLFWGNAEYVSAEETDAGKKIIHIVYDNSSSTYRRGKGEYEYVSYWAEINYGVQAFCAMTNEEDKISIYYTSDAEPESPDIIEYADTEDLVNKIKEIPVRSADEAGHTEYSSVKQAICDWGENSETGIEKWVVIFTDGKFEKLTSSVYQEMTNKELYRALTEELEGKEDIKVCYISMEKNNRFTDYNNEQIYQPEEGEDIAEQLLDVCNHIYGRKALPKENGQGTLDGNQLKINFDIPVTKCFLYAYCEERILGEPCTEDKNKCISIQAPEKINIDTDSQIDEIEKDERTGFIVELKTYPLKNEYQYNVEFQTVPQDKSWKYEVYYETEYTVVPHISNEPVKEFEQVYWEGEYAVTLVFQNLETKDEINSDSKFWEAEHITVSALHGNNEKTELKESKETKLWTGTAEEGKVTVRVLNAANKEVGEETFEFLKDYRLADLKAELNDVYEMDTLDKKEQYITLQAMLDEKNVTGDIQALSENNGQLIFDFSLEKDNKYNDALQFTYEYDSLAECWRIYPEFKDGADYFMNGDYDFRASAELVTDVYPEATICIKMKEAAQFNTGISDGKLEIKLEQPWEYKIHPLPFPHLEKCRISVLWNGQELPANVIQDIKVTGSGEQELSYVISNYGKKYLSLENKKNIIGFYFMDNKEDTLSIEADVVLFGIQKQAYKDNITIEIIGMNTWERIAFIMVWTAVLLLGGILTVNLYRYKTDVKARRRFPLRTRVYRSYDNGKNRIKGKIKRKRKRDSKDIRYTEYTLINCLPKEFGNDRENKIKIRRNENKIQVYDIKNKQSYGRVYLGNNIYSEFCTSFQEGEKIYIEDKTLKSRIKIWIDMQEVLK